MRNNVENPMFAKDLQNALREGYNFEDTQTGRQWLKRLRLDDEYQAALLTPDVEARINDGFFGDQVKTVYLRFLEFSEQPLSPEQIKFLQKNRDLLY